MENWSEYILEIEKLLNKGDLTFEGKEYLKFIKKIILTHKIDYVKFHTNYEILKREIYLRSMGDGGTESLNQIINSFEIIPLAYDSHCCPGFAAHPLSLECLNKKVPLS